MTKKCNVLEDKKAYLICPVRGHDPQETRAVVENLEQAGWSVHWPPRDTAQQDPTGYNICRENLAAIRKADCIFVIWDGKSEGCLFDLGIAFALEKPLSIVALPSRTEGKSFQNMMEEWSRLGGAIQWEMPCPPTRLA